MNRTTSRFPLHYDAVKKSLSPFFVGLFAISCLLSMGCDMGTYNQRLNEQPVEPAPETTEPADDGEATADDEAVDDEAADDQQ